MQHESTSYSKNTQSRNVYKSPGSSTSSYNNVVSSTQQSQQSDIKKYQKKYEKISVELKSERQKTKELQAMMKEMQKKLERQEKQLEKKSQIEDILLSQIEQLKLETAKPPSSHKQQGHESTHRESGHFQSSQTYQNNNSLSNEMNDSSEIERGSSYMNGKKNQKNSYESHKQSKFYTDSYGNLPQDSKDNQKYYQPNANRSAQGGNSTLIDQHAISEGLQPSGEQYTAGTSYSEEESQQQSKAQYIQQGSQKSKKSDPHSSPSNKNLVGGYFSQVFGKR